MASVTAKQVRRSLTKNGEYPDLRDRAEEAAQERVAMHQSLLHHYTCATFDIEATSLNASFGHALCATIKPVGCPPIVFSIHESKGYKDAIWDDRELVVRVRDALEKCDIIVTWNGQEYDIPFLDQRLTIHGERRIWPVHHIDLLPIARRKLRMHSNRLDAVSDSLRIVRKKTPLIPEVWQKAGAGHRPSLDEVIEHNVVDTQVLEDVFAALKPYVDAIYRKR